MTTVDIFGSSLRWWRTTRRYSQLQLANQAEVSSRHLSFLETGRARPSREMVLHLARVLDLPLRDRNMLLHSAGFAPAYSHGKPDGPEMTEVREVLAKIIEAHQPSPAIVIDRQGDLIDANRAAMQLLAATVDPASPVLQGAINIHRISLHPQGVKPRSGNWAVVAATLVERLQRELAHRPTDEQLKALVDEVLAYPDIPSPTDCTATSNGAAQPSGTDLLVPLQLTTFDGHELRLVTTIATVGTPYDVTVEEIRLETFFAADQATANVLESWQAASIAEGDPAAAGQSAGRSRGPLFTES